MQSPPLLALRPTEPEAGTCLSGDDKCAWEVSVEKTFLCVAPRMRVSPRTASAPGRLLEPRRNCLWYDGSIGCARRSSDSAADDAIVRGVEAQVSSCGEEAAASQSQWRRNQVECRRRGAFATFVHCQNAFAQLAGSCSATDSDGHASGDLVEATTASAGGVAGVSEHDGVVASAAGQGSPPQEPQPPRQRAAARRGRTRQRRREARMSEQVVAQVLLASAADAAPSASPGAAAMGDATSLSKHRRRRTRPMSRVVANPQEEAVPTASASGGARPPLCRFGDQSGRTLREFPLSAWVPNSHSQPLTSMADAGGCSCRSPSSGRGPPSWTSCSVDVASSPHSIDLRAPERPGPAWWSSATQPTIVASRPIRAPDRPRAWPSCERSPSNSERLVDADRGVAFTPRGLAGRARPRSEDSTRIAAAILAEFSRRRARAGSASSSPSPERQAGELAEGGVFLQEFPLSAWAPVQNSQGA